MTATGERLKVTITETSPSRRQIEAELRAEDAAAELERITAEYAGGARLKGFRRGRVPKDMVKQVYGPEIRHALIDALVPKVLDEVLSERHIHPASVPVVEDVVFEEGSPLSLKAVVEVWPDFVLPAYAKVRLPRKDADVADADVERAVDELRGKAAEYVPVEDRGVVNGDYVVVELQGRDLKTKRLRPAEKAALLAGREGNDKTVDAQLFGMREGETKVFRQIYPPESPHKALAGKEVEYTLKVLSLKAEKRPALDDEFARSLGEYQGLKDLQDKIRAELLKARQLRARRESSEEILKRLLEQTAIELPESIVQEEAEKVLHKTLGELRAEAVTPALVEDLRVRAREQAAASLKRTLLLKRIAEAESLAVTEEEIDWEIRSLAQANGVPEARLLESFEAEGRRESLRTTLLLRRAIDFLVDRAIME